MNDTASRFEKFHQTNPHVYVLLVALAREYLAATRRDRVGMSLLFGRARWELGISTDEAAPVLNNDYASFYSRLLAAEPDWADLFELRWSLDADHWAHRLGLPTSTGWRSGILSGSLVLEDAA